jgi:hypothetical protein
MSLITENLSREYCPIPLSQEKAKKMLPYIAACNASYKNDEKWILPFGLSFFHPNGANFNLNALPGKIEAREVCFFDKDSLLKVSICMNEKVAIYVLAGAFGAADCETQIEEERNTFRRIQTHTRESQIEGKIPLSYLQLIGLIKIVTQHPSLKEKKITVVGVSSGGSMAQYVGLKKTLRTICFNPYPIGQGLQNKVGQKKLNVAHHYLFCISAKNDYCSDAMERGLNKNDKIKYLQEHSAKNFGLKYLIPAAYEEEDKIHAFLTGSLMKYLNYDVRTLTSQLKPEDLKFGIEELSGEKEISKEIVSLLQHPRQSNSYFLGFERNYSCQSSLAIFAQSTSEGDFSRQQLAFFFLDPEDKRIICKCVWKNEEGSPESKIYTWEKYGIFEDPSHLMDAIQQDIFEKLNSLSQDQKNQVYEQFYYLCGWPETEDYSWGEHNCTRKELLPQLADALSHVLSA